MGRAYKSDWVEPSDLVLREYYIAPLGGEKCSFQVRELPFVLDEVPYELGQTHDGAVSTVFLPAEAEMLLSERVSLHEVDADIVW